MQWEEAFVATAALLGEPLLSLGDALTGPARDRAMAWVHAQPGDKQARAALLAKRLSQLALDIDALRLS